MSRPKHTQRQRLTAALLGIAVVHAFLLTGCVPDRGPGVSDMSDGATSDDQAGTGNETNELLEGIPAELLPYYAQRVAWEDCGRNQCAKVIAPMNWEEPDGKKVEIAMVKREANGQAIGSLFTNPGGPGASGFDLVASSANFMFSKDLLDQYDLIGWDPRGVGKSSPVQCFGTEEEKDEFISFTEVDVDENDPRYYDTILEMYQPFIDGCVKYSGALLENLDTISTVKDLDMMRVLVGDSKLNYLGFSYGAYMGGVYAEQFPDRVGRLVLDGPVDPAVDIVEVGKAQTMGFEVGYLQYLDACLRGDLGTCPFNGTKQEAIDSTIALLASLEQSPLIAEDGRKLWGSTFLLSMVTSLYSSDTWNYLSQTLNEVNAGDPTTAFLLIDFYNDRNPDGSYNDNSFEASIAINCMDYPSEYDPEKWRANDRELAAAAPILGPYNGGSGALCSAWPAKPKEERRVITAPGAAPILVVGNVYDTATPYEWAVNLADALSSGHLLTREGQGHTSYSLMNRCTMAAVDTFLLTGELPAEGKVCVE